jgi:hypothetical protein
MNESDFLGLPSTTRNFVQRLIELGFDRERIYGFFILVGLYAGAPNTQEKIEELFSCLQEILPVDRSKNIDEDIGHLYGGYDKEINEFCYRSGLTAEYFSFREIKVPKVEKIFYIAYLQDEGVLATDVRSVDKLCEATRLIDAFILALGKRSSSTEATLLEAFSCGMFQIALHTKSDVQGSIQIAKAIRSLLPPLFDRCFYSVISNKVDYFLGLETGQLALLSLMQESSPEYAQQMWGFQSSLFFRDGQAISGIDQLTNHEWHQWVIKNCEGFGAAYPSQLLPFSQSTVTLEDLPIWGKTVKSFEFCDDYINKVWGYKDALLQNNFQYLEYRALLVHVVYSSLTSSRETRH